MGDCGGTRIVGGGVRLAFQLRGHRNAGMRCFVRARPRCWQDAASARPGDDVRVVGRAEHCSGGPKRPDGGRRGAVCILDGRSRMVRRVVGGAGLELCGWGAGRMTMALDGPDGDEAERGGVSRETVESGAASACCALWEGASVGGGEGWWKGARHPGAAAQEWRRRAGGALLRSGDCSTWHRWARGSRPEVRPHPCG